MTKIPPKGGTEMENQGSIKWTAVIWAALLMFILPLLVTAYFMIGSAGNVTAVWDEILIIAVMVLGGAYLGSLLKPSQAAAA